MTPSLKTLARPETIAAPGRPNPVALDQQSLALAVALVAFLLPVALWLGAALTGLCLQSSISHYVYLPLLGGVFVAALGFISIFMWNYPGHTTSDRWMARAGSVLAILVALIPTSGPGCAREVFHARPQARLTGAGSELDAFAFNLEAVFGFDGGMLHLAAAGLFFAVLAWFCLWSFRRDNGEGVEHKDGGAVKSRAKTLRNRLYLGCGLLILVAMGAIALIGPSQVDSASALPPVFALEALALWAFALSWAVKGRLLRTMRD